MHVKVCYLRLKFALARNLVRADTVEQLQKLLESGISARISYQRATWGPAITDTRDTVNLMEMIIQEISSGQCNRSKVRIRKRYLNDAPMNEEPTPCPRCSSRDQRNMVRYLYININEAIYKCEAPDCMYPFGNYKYKNFETNTVYQYENPDGAMPFCDISSTVTLDPLVPAYSNLDFVPLSPSAGTKHCVTEANGTKALSSKPATTFNVDVFDEILKDLWSSTSSANATPKIEPSSTVSSLVSEGELKNEPTSNSNPSPPAKSRKLEKCLKAVEQTKTKMRKSMFKYPRKHKAAEPANAKHVVETITETKLRITKIPSQLPKDLRSANNVELNNILKGLVYDKDIKPAEFMDTLRNVSRRALPCPSDKTQQMLHFINKSMDSRENKESLRVIAPSSPTALSVQTPNPANDAPTASSVAPSVTIGETPLIQIKTCEPQNSSGGMDLFIKLLE